MLVLCNIDPINATRDLTYWTHLCGDTAPSTGLACEAVGYVFPEVNQALKDVTSTWLNAKGPYAMMKHSIAGGQRYWLEWRGKWEGTLRTPSSELASESPNASFRVPETPLFETSAPGERMCVWPMFQRLRLTSLGEGRLGARRTSI